MRSLLYCFFGVLICCFALPGPASAKPRQAQEESKQKKGKWSITKALGKACTKIDRVVNGMPEDEQLVRNLLDRGVAEGDLDRFVVVRELTVQPEFRDEYVRNVRKCRGHHLTSSTFGKWYANKCAETDKQRYSEDERIAEYSVTVEQTNGEENEYAIHAYFRHKDDYCSCNNYELEPQVLREASWEEHNTWTPNWTELAALENSDTWSLAEKTTLEGPATKEIDGREITRDCWKEELIFVRRTG